MELSGKQITEARRFYRNHRNWVNSLLMSEGDSFPPTDKEDKNSPALWKAGHWKWFFENTK